MVTEHQHDWRALHTPFLNNTPDIFKIEGIYRNSIWYCTICRIRELFNGN